MNRVLVPAIIARAHPPINCPVRDFSGQTMGTRWSVRLVDTVCRPDREWQADIQALLDRVVAQMSHWLADSDLGKYNRAAPGAWHALPEDFLIVMRCALEIAEQSQGAYDPSAGALVNLWGFGPGDAHAAPDFALPDFGAIAQALEDCGWQRVHIDATSRLFQPGGLRLDLSAIAKGYGVDLVARYLQTQGIDHFLVEVGGELRGEGMKPDGQPWWVGLESPPDAALPAALLALHGLSVATSGDYRRFFEYEGCRYAHTLDPRTGYPLPDRLASVTVLHAECMHADAWSTALGVMGLEAGLACADARSLAARFLVRENGVCREYQSAAFSEMLEA